MSTTDDSSELTYRRLYIGLWALSGVSFGGLTLLGRPLAGAVAFAVCGLAALALFRRYEGPLFDERDRRRRAEASHRTLRIVGLTAAVVFPAVTALWGIGVLDWPLWLTPVAFTVAGLAFVHVGTSMYGYVHTA